MKLSYVTSACWDRFMLRLVSPVVRQGELSHNGEPVCRHGPEFPFIPKDNYHAVA